VRGAKFGDVVVIDVIELTPFGVGNSAILRDFGVLRREFPEPMALSSPVRDGRDRFGRRIPLSLNSSPGTSSTMPPKGYKPSYAGAYAGDFDQKGACQRSRVYLSVLPGFDNVEPPLFWARRQKCCAIVWSNSTNLSAYGQTASRSESRDPRSRPHVGAFLSSMTIR
jgi:hypothetical protein